MVVIRSARRGDIEPVLALWEVAAGPTRLPGTRGSMVNLLERDAEALIVADCEREIVGTLIVGWDGWRCHLYRLAVRSDFRRQHIATQLVAHARDRARGLGARRLDAMVDDDNELGRNFWQGIGFALGPSDDRRWTTTL